MEKVLKVEDSGGKWNEKTIWKVTTTEREYSCLDESAKEFIDKEITEGKDFTIKELKEYQGKKQYAMRLIKTDQKKSSGSSSRGKSHEEIVTGAKTMTLAYAHKTVDSIITARGGDIPIKEINKNIQEIFVSSYALLNIKE